MSSVSAFQPYLNRESTDSRIQSDDNFRGTFANGTALAAAGTVLPLVSIQRDNAGGGNLSGVYTFVNAGRYIVEVHIDVTNVTSTEFKMIVQSGGPSGVRQLAADITGVAPINNVSVLKCSSVDDFEVGDYIEIAGFSDNSDSLTTGITGAQSFSIKPI